MKGVGIMMVFCLMFSFGHGRRRRGEVGKSRERGEGMYCMYIK